ncbi:MAG: hypothetical protein IKD69_14495, partial [Solobacterium sp.]|nr:hypothetical protein [Solobacterium sp.]
MFQKLKEKKPPVYLLFALAFLFFEAVLRQASSNTPWLPAIAFMAFFSLTYGLLLYLLSSFGPPWFNRTVRFVLLLATGVLFGVNYFIFRQFKVLYDINTVLTGA